MKLTPEEDASLRQLGAMLEQVPPWRQQANQLDGGWQVVSGSELDQDDTATHPYEASSGAWSAILAAISHMMVLQDSLFEDTGPNNVTARIHSHGQLTLVRGALENASLALWLLEPDQRDVRIMRRIQQEWDEIKQLSKVRDLVGNPLDPPLDQREIRLKAMLTNAGAPANQLKQRPGYEEIVGYAGDLLPHKGKVARVVWKACSALAHGETRGMAAYLDKETLGPASPGAVWIKMTGNTELMAIGGLFSFVTTKTALELYKRRSGATLTI